jgi:hypothetical protein
MGESKAERVERCAREAGLFDRLSEETVESLADRLPRADIDRLFAEIAEARAETLSGDHCPFCGAALLVGEAIHDCRKCRADIERDAEFHRRNPGVRAAARDPLAGIL